MIGTGRAAFLAGLAASGAAVAAPRIASAVETVNIINTASNDSFAIQGLIRDRKYFSALGIAENTQNVSDGVKLMASVVNGASDIAILTGFGQVFSAIENGAPIKVVGSAILPVSFSLYTANPAVKTVKDLEGKSIGTGAVGALIQSSTAAVLRKNGVDLSKVTFVNIGSSSDIFRAVAAGKVDAGGAQHEFAHTAAQLGVRVIAEYDKQIPQFTNQGAFAPVSAIAEKRDLLVKTLAAYGRFYRFIDGPTSKPDWIRAYKQQVGPDTEELATDLWQWFQETKAFNVAIALSPERIAYMQQLNVALGVQKNVLPYERVADMSIARDAAILAAKGPA